MRFALVLLIFGISFNFGYAQKRRGKHKPVTFQKHYKDIMPYSPQYKMSGWFFGPGATYMLTPFVPINKKFDETDVSRYDVKLKALGRPAAYAEIGRYHMLPYWKVFKYMDYGISYKGLRGRESSEGQYVTLPNETPIAGTFNSTSGTFGYHFAEAFVNFNHNWRLGKYNFLQHSLGANAGYAFNANFGGGTVAPETMNPGKISAQLHYKLGFGIKRRGNWILIPALETPILNLMPFEPPRSATGFFGSRYRPIIFSLRVLLMRPANTLDCTPVRTKDGLFMPTDIGKQKEMDGVK